MSEFIETYPVRSLFNVQSIRNIEQQLFELSDSFAIMQQAATALFKRTVQRWPDVQRFAIVVGGGNNGGDGLLLAVLLKEAGYFVQVLDCTSRARRGDALKAYNAALGSGVACSGFEKGVADFNAFSLENLVLVDAVLGIGARLPLSDSIVKVVQWMNQAKSVGAHIVAVDIPTGVESDSGYAVDVVMADMTVSMVQLKLGNVLGKGGIASGDVVNESLGSLGMLPEPSARWLELARLDHKPPCPRQKDSHKGIFGHVAVVGGDHGFGGAAIMASEAASKAGAGTVALLTRAEHVSASLSRNPNVMVLTFDMEQAESLIMRGNTVLVIGPGLGRASWGKSLFDAWLSIAHQRSCPMVLDADGLFWLSQSDNATLPEGAIITPHLGEAARLLNWSIERIQQDPVAACFALTKQYRCTVVLKGTSTIVADFDGKLYVTGKAEPVLAKGGAGDVLSGMIAASLAYYKEPLVASVLAVAWHNHAASSSAVALGEHSAQPYDLLNYLD